MGEQRGHPWLTLIVITALCLVGWALFGLLVYVVVRLVS